MSGFELIGLIFVLLSCFGVINHMTLKLPDTLGITAIGLLLSTALIAVLPVFPEVYTRAQQLTKAIDFQGLVFNGVLSFLLFAGSMQIKIETIAKEKWTIFALATIGVVISTFVIGTVLFLLLPLSGLGLPLMYCFLFGALISPTDPVVVMGILKRCNIADNLQAKIAGESLFNDATGLVLFTLLSGIVLGRVDVSASTIALLLLKEIGGAVLIGGICGYFAYWIIRQIDDYPLEILVTLCLPTAAYSLAQSSHANGPLTVVIAGLIIGNKGLRNAVSEQTKAHMVHFWELTDELLNLVLFGLIGLQLLNIHVSIVYIWAGLLAVIACLSGRYFSVALPIAVLKKTGLRSKRTLTLTWGGLRGGISIALALSLPASGYQNTILALTYAVVLFSILVQATTLKLVVDWLFKKG